jgi:hypothetical protein
METIYSKINYFNTKYEVNSCRTNTMRTAIQKRLLDTILFCIPTLKFLEFEIVGRLFATDIILITIFPITLILKFKRLSNCIVKMIIFFGLLWLANQIITDLIRNIDSIDYYRGWAKICVTMMHFTTLYLIINNNNKRIIIFILGICLGDILSFFFNPNIYAIDYPWKFGVGNPFTLIIILMSSLLYKKSFVLCSILLSLACVLNLYMGFRSLSGICFLTTIYLLIEYNFLSNKKNEIKLSLRQVIILFSLLILASMIFLKGYEQLANKGILGNTAKLKYVWQSSGDLGILIGGRSEILVASQAIINSPIIGYGSWAKDFYFTDILNNIMRSMGYSQNVSNDLNLIPTHSYFFGAWVEAGILGAVFWGVIMIMIIQILTTKYNFKTTLFPLIIFIAFHLSWDILFSPFGADQRFTTPFYIIIMITFLPEKVNLLKFYQPVRSNL